MAFNSWQFLVFLPIVVLFYYILPHKIRWIWLLAASYFFYMCYDPWLIFLILATTGVSYLSGRLLEKTTSPKGRKALLVVSIVVCLGLLVFFKYFNFLLDSVLSLLRVFQVKVDSVSFNIILPIGISFYTFQTLSYVIDVYRGKYKAERHLGYYALFVSFFPQLVAGPIERPDKLIPQLKEKHNFDLDDFLVGFRIMVCGFFFKVCIADFCGIIVQNVYGNLSSATSLSMIAATLLFCFQIYGDFNGYSEIATGSARMMGIRLTRNFNRPYTSFTYGEYFRRWHISLNSWFTEYLYIPLGGNRKGKVRKEINVLIVFLLCGLWHGANWTYVIWGAIVGVFVVLEDTVGVLLGYFFAKRNIDTKKGAFGVIRRILFFLFMVPGTTFFRSLTVSDAARGLGIVFTGFSPTIFQDTVSSLGIDIPSLLYLIFSLLFMEFLISFSEINRNRKTEPGFTEMDTKKLCLHVGIIAIAITCIGFMWISALGTGSTSPFAYFQF